jgi:hypothetical protein
MRNWEVIIDWPEVTIDWPELKIDWPEVEPWPDLHGWDCET